jgi:hypothetical protein
MRGADLIDHQEGREGPRGQDLRTAHLFQIVDSVQILPQQGHGPHRAHVATCSEKGLPSQSMFNVHQEGQKGAG